MANFSIEYTQFLNEQGEISHPLPENLNDPTLLLELYHTMVKVRAFDAKAVHLQRTGQMGTYASVLGQEAIGTAIGKVMRPDDVFAPFYRDQPAQLQRGVTMTELYRYWGGDEHGSCYQQNQDDLPIAIPIASQCLHAAGVAFAFKYRSESRVAVTTVGDGGTSEGDFYEAMNAAGTWQLPLVFVINNNQWAISVPRHAQTRAETLAQKAIAAGIPGEQVDGNDVLAVYHAMEQALQRARAGKGPSVIEALTYRLCDHTTADDASRYRPKEELEKAIACDPIKRVRLYLQQQSQWTQEQEKELQETVKKEVEQAVCDYLAAPPPKVGDIFEYHFSELPEELRKQREQALEGIKHA